MRRVLDRSSFAAGSHDVLGRVRDGPRLGFGLVLELGPDRYSRLAARATHGDGVRAAVVYDGESRPGTLARCQVGPLLKNATGPTSADPKTGKGALVTEFLSIGAKRIPTEPGRSLLGPGTHEPYQTVWDHRQTWAGRWAM